MSSDIEAAAAAVAPVADSLANELREDGSLTPLYAHLERTIEELSAAGYEPGDLLPATDEPGLGFSLRDKRDGKTLWQAIALAGRDAICKSDSAVRKSVGGGTGSVVTAIIVTLGLPVFAAPIAAVLAAFILASGIDGFCRWSAAPVDEPRTG